MECSDEGISVSLKDIAIGFEMTFAMIRASLGDANAWEGSIRGFEAEDAIRQPTKDGIVFTGSSSFTFWSTLAQDMAPLAVLNRAFGGSMIGDVVRYADRIVIPYEPRIVVLFAGANDVVTPGPDPARRVADGFAAFVARIHGALPETLICYVAITPTPKGRKFWPLAQEANRLIQEQVTSDSRLRFIDLTDLLVKSDGTPDETLYRRDGHPNERCYALWASRLKPILEVELAAQQAHRADVER